MVFADGWPKPSSNRPDPQAAGIGGCPDHIAVLVVGLDGSDTSWDAFSWACGETQRLRGRLVAVLVTPYMPGAAAAAVPGASVCPWPASEDAVAAQLRVEAHRGAAGHDLDFSFIHARGDTASELLRIAQALHADQIVVGRSSQLRHRLIGALGRRLMVKRAAPVVVIVP
jgi:nucleotide-binding universal stress UspA family protein